MKNRIVLDGWDPTVKFTNLSNIIRLVTISRVATHWNRGQLRLARVSHEEYEAACLNLCSLHPVFCTTGSGRGSDATT